MKALILKDKGRAAEVVEVARPVARPGEAIVRVEAAALKAAMREGLIESREPMLLCYDVLIQYLGTLAISDGFYPEVIFRELQSTYCYSEMTEDEWTAWVKRNVAPVRP